MELAEAADLSSGYIGDIEAQRRFPSDQALQALAEALDVKVSELFLEQGDRVVPGEGEEHHSNALRRMKKEVIATMERVLREYRRPRTWNRPLGSE